MPVPVGRGSEGARLRSHDLFVNNNVGNRVKVI